MIQYDVVVVGAGKIGRKIAVNLANLGKKVAIVTLNDDSATLFERTIETITHGQASPDPVPHGPPNVDTYRGTPQFRSKKFQIEIGDAELEAKDVVIATGSNPKLPPIQNLEQTPHHTPLSILSESHIPESILIGGAGPIGVSLAQRLIEKRRKPILMATDSRILPTEEPEISEVLERNLDSSGVKIVKNSRLVQTRTLPNKKISCVYKSNGDQKELDVESLVLATGFKANVDGFGLDRWDPYIDGDGYLSVDDLMQTSTPHLWAAGSVTQNRTQIGFHHHQAQLLINNITAPFFSKSRLENEPVPIAVPTVPPAARLGDSQKDAEQKYKDCKTIVVPTSNQTDGIVKLIGRSKSGEILGVHICGPSAAEMILYFNLAKRAEIPLYDLLDRQHYPSPTHAEIVYAAIQKWVSA